MTKETNASVAQAAATFKERRDNGTIKRRRQTNNIKTQYKNDCAFKFNVYDYPEMFDLNLLTEYGWYHPVTNPLGISRDHIVSVAYGFKHNVDPKIISHIANCNIMLHSENNKKNIRSDLLIEELISKIELW